MQDDIFWPHCANTLWPRDPIWQHRTGSTSAQVMACCMTAPRHYLNKCWLIIRKVIWHSSESMIIRSEDTCKSTKIENGNFLNEIYEFRLRFQWSLFLRFQLTIFQHWFKQWLGAGQVTSHCLNPWWFVYWCVYTSLGLNELKSHPDLPGTNELIPSRGPISYGHTSIRNLLVL